MSMADLSDATPFFSTRTFLISFVYHFVNFFILGPLTFLVVIPFSGKWYAKNTGFLPGG